MATKAHACEVSSSIEIGFSRFKRCKSYKDCANDDCPTSKIAKNKNERIKKEMKEKIKKENDRKKRQEIQRKQKNIRK